MQDIATRSRRVLASSHTFSSQSHTSRIRTSTTVHRPLTDVACSVLLRLLSAAFCLAIVYREGGSRSSVRVRASRYQEPQQRHGGMRAVCSAQVLWWSIMMNGNAHYQGSLVEGKWPPASENPRGSTFTSSCSDMHHVRRCTIPTRVPHRYNVGRKYGHMNIFSHSWEQNRLGDFLPQVFSRLSHDSLPTHHILSILSALLGSPSRHTEWIPR